MKGESYIPSGLDAESGAEIQEPIYGHGDPDPDLIKTDHDRAEVPSSKDAALEREEPIFSGALGGSVLFKFQDRSFTRRLKELIGDDPTGEKFTAQLEEFDRNILGGRGKKSDEQRKLLDDFRKIIQGNKREGVASGGSMAQTEPLISAAIEVQLEQLAKKLGKKLPVVEPEGMAKIKQSQKKKNVIRKIWDRITGNREAA